MAEAPVKQLPASQAAGQGRRRRSRFSLPHIFGTENSPSPTMVIPEVMQDRPIGDRRPKTLKAIARKFDLKHGYILNAFLLFLIYSNDGGETLSFEEFCDLLGLDQETRDSMYLLRSFRTAVKDDAPVGSSEEHLKAVRTDFTGFLRLVSSLESATAGDKADFCFNALDKLNIGNLQPEDLEVLVLSSIETMKKADIDAFGVPAEGDPEVMGEVQSKSDKLFRKYDANGDGKLSRSEFFLLFEDEPNILAPFVAVFDVLGWLAKQALGKGSMTIEELSMRVKTGVGSRKLKLTENSDEAFKRFTTSLMGGKMEVLKGQEAAGCKAFLSTLEVVNATGELRRRVSHDVSRLEAQHID
mmetsp:Transcript_39484/g.101353  ORF Transcript_39484/g.101353 Transcript_39484/m.101353 type:complete len:356 (-) Transcript_39484:253-1320(-)